MHLIHCIKKHFIYTGMPFPQRGGQKLLITTSVFFSSNQKREKNTDRLTVNVMYLSIHLTFRNVYVHLYIAKSGSISRVHTAS